MKMGGAGTGWGLRRLLEPGLVGGVRGDADRASFWGVS